MRNTWSMWEKDLEGYFKIIYLIEGRTIYIMDFFDTRQEPENMKGKPILH